VKQRGRKNMGSKQKQTQIGRKTNFERRLEERLSLLSEKGIESTKINKDTIVKKLRANIRAVNDRLKAVAANEQKTEELAKVRAEKAAVPPKVEESVKEKKAKEVPPEEGKEKKKKKVKEPKEAAASQEKVKE
jgi:DNA polymerase III delta prime subunit